MIIHPSSALGPPVNDGHAFTLYAAILIDYAWFSRHLVIHHGTEIDIMHIHETIRKLFEEYQHSWSEKLEVTSTSWVPPPNGSWKINFDVAIRDSFSIGAAVCRDPTGSILFARTKRLPPSSPLRGEARAALFAAQEAHSLGRIPSFLKATT